MQKYVGEIDWLRKKVHENPSSMLYSRLAERYLLLKEFDRAVEFAEKGAILHPHYPTARYVLAKCYFERQQFDLANGNLKEALADDPFHPASLKLQNELFKRLGDIEKMKSNIVQMLEIDPIDDQLARQLSELENGSLDEPSTMRPPLSTTINGTLEEDWDQAITNQLAEREREMQQADLRMDIKESSIPGAQPENPFDDFENDINNHRQTEETRSRPADFRSDEVLDEKIDYEYEIDATRYNYQEEENKFTELLDTIFSPGIDAEEKRVEKERSAIERIVSETPEHDEQVEERPVNADLQSRFKPLLPQDKPLSPEEEILKSGRKDDEDLFNLPDAESFPADEETLPEEFLALDDKIDPAEQKTSEWTSSPTSESASAKADSPSELDFSDFLATLNFHEDTVAQPSSSGAKEPDSGSDIADQHRFFDDDQFDFDFDLSQRELNSGREAEKEDEWVMPPRTPEPAPQPEEDKLRSEKNEDEATPEETEGRSGKSRGKFYTPTLGEIYAAQGQYAKAIIVYETLIKNNPENDWYRQKLEFLKKKLAEQENL
ncbi:MAG: hypothetical protein EHM72_01300 [Calditrichaeota bacterium]|nr:MAG: hypothetical protein EHM72_01300 [Calditrichota bacterium]